MRYQQLFLISLLGLTATAQETSLSNLKAPQSPAASIIGLQPSSISRPKSWEALESALFSNFYSNGALAVPNDFALEFSPFWASNKQKLSIERFLSPKWRESFIQNLAFSVASTQAFHLNDSMKSNAIGFGVRTMLVGGKAGEARKMSIYRLTMDLAALSQRMFQLAEQQMEADTRSALTAAGKPTTPSDVESAMIAATITAAQFTAFQNAWSNDMKIKRLLTNPNDISANDDLVQKLEAWLKANPAATIDAFSEVLDDLTGLNGSVKDLVKAREDPRGFRLEVAASSMLNFPTNESDYSFVPKAGVWLTPSYQHAQWNSFEALGVVRYLWYRSTYFRRYDNDFGSFDQNFDMGIRLVLKKEKFSLEGEAVRRWSRITLSESFNAASGETTTISKSEDDLQYLVNLNYQLQENLTLSYTFGKQLDPQLNLNIGGDVVSLLALNVGFGAPKLSNGKLIR